MTSGTATAPHPSSPTAVAIAASSRPRWDSRTTSRGAAWRPRGRRESVSDGVVTDTKVYASREQPCFYDRPPFGRASPTTPPPEPPADPPNPDPAPRRVRVGIVGAGFA